MGIREPMLIDAVLPQLRTALRQQQQAVLTAPPGAGKTTGVPLALLDEPWLGNLGILLLEPRRLAARMAARRMAFMLGEELGETVGYHIRQDRCRGPGTRILVVTEGMLIRYLQSDPSLAAYGAVIFDEFHERSLLTDLSLALTLDAREILRPDLRLLVMSATVDGAAVSRLLGAAPVLDCAGRSHPIETRYAGRDRRGEVPLLLRVVRHILSTLRREEGSILVFLPGGPEIRHAQRLLQAELANQEITIAPLYGDLPKAQQDQAVLPPPPGRKKVVLATAIAETSLTIEGIRTVIDSGWMRVPQFDPVRGLTRLETVRVSRACADQRRGRAGRTGPGVCIRLWPESATSGLAPFTPPEILSADLAPLALELARWGECSFERLKWLDPPPDKAFLRARGLLTELGALDGAGKLTIHGAEMAALPLHPRLAHMVITAARAGFGRLACYIAALIDETRDIIRFAGTEDADPDARARMEILLAPSDTPALPPGAILDRQAVRFARNTAGEWCRQLNIPDDEPVDLGLAGRAIALAFPERVAQLRGDAPGHFLLASGQAARLPVGMPVARAPLLAIAALSGDRQRGRIYLAAPLEERDLELLFADRIEDHEHVVWDSRERAVSARRQRRFGQIVLRDGPLANGDSVAITAAMSEGIRQLGLNALPWTGAARTLQARICFVRRMCPTGLNSPVWPDVSDSWLIAHVEEWLGPFLAGMTREAHLTRLNLEEALNSLLDYQQRRALDRLAPERITVPSGSRSPIDYSGDRPVLAVRLQELFGLHETPAICDGQVKLLLHLLSPAGRPLQVTDDLGGFWAGTYQQVKKEMKGRYPKHYWPDDPDACPPTRRAKPRGD